MEDTPQDPSEAPINCPIDDDKVIQVSRLAALPNYCTACGEHFPSPYAKFCPGCGTSRLGILSQPSPRPINNCSRDEDLVTIGSAKYSYSAIQKVLGVFLQAGTFTLSVAILNLSRGERATQADLIPIGILFGFMMLFSLLSRQFPLVGDIAMTIGLCLPLIQTSYFAGGFSSDKMIWFKILLWPALACFFVGHIIFTANSSPKNYRLPVMQLFKLSNLKRPAPLYPLVFFVIYMGIALFVIWAQSNYWVDPRKDKSVFFTQQGFTIMGLGVFGGLSLFALSGSLYIPSLVTASLIPQVLVNIGKQVEILSRVIAVVAAIALCVACMFGAVYKLETDRWEQFPPPAHRQRAQRNDSCEADGDEDEDEEDTLFLTPGGGLTNALHGDTDSLYLSKTARFRCFVWLAVLAVGHVTAAIAMSVVWKHSNEHLVESVAWGDLMQFGCGTVLFYTMNAIALYYESDLLSACCFVTWSVAVSFPNWLPAPLQIVTWIFGFLATITDSIIFSQIIDSRESISPKMYTPNNQLVLCCTHYFVINILRVVNIVCSLVGLCIITVHAKDTTGNPFSALFSFGFLWIAIFGVFRTALVTAHGLEVPVVLVVLSIIYAAAFSTREFSVWRDPIYGLYLIQLFLNGLCNMGIRPRRFTIVGERRADESSGQPDVEQQLPPVGFLPSPELREINDQYAADL